MPGALLLLPALLLLAHALGWAFARLRQPRVVGEILGGALIGPTVLGRVWPGITDALTPRAAWEKGTVDVVSTAGLVLLMLLSGAGMRGLLVREDRRAVTWMAVSGTALPFAFAVAIAARLPLDSIRGPQGGPIPLVLVLGIAAAVTSIPVISRIFHDLGLLETRFARLVLGVAVLEDVALWGVLAVATALAASAELAVAGIAKHVGATLVYVTVALALGPALRRLQRSPKNGLALAAPAVWAAAVLALYAGPAWAIGVKPMFAAFFAGLALDGDGPGMRRALDLTGKVAFASAIPVYFALVGWRLDFGAGFSLTAALVLLVLCCAVKLASVALGARMAGFRGIEVANLAIATNARGGPGIVLASAALDAGIVNPAGFTALVILAVVTSQAAGAWLEQVVRRGWPLLREPPSEAMVRSGP